MLYTIMPSIAPTIVPEIIADSVNVSFFQGFSFDTLLGCIDCVTAIIALFVGGVAYRRCIKLKKSFNDKKEFNDNSKDYSQRAAGDIINNNGIGAAELEVVKDGFIAITNANFSQALDNVYIRMQEQSDNNLRIIMEKTKEEIDKKKWQISEYTKLDWIHIYLENAKNTSDTYMQSVWSKVLAYELMHPNTFSIKTLEIIKCLTEIEFRAFEKIGNIAVNGSFLVKGDELKELGLNWLTLQLLKDHGLISLEGSQDTISIAPNSAAYKQIGKSYLLKVSNTSALNVEIVVPGYLITVFGQEILHIIDEGEFFKEVCTMVDMIMKRDSSQSLVLTLHRIVEINKDGKVKYGGIEYSAQKNSNK